MLTAARRIFLRSTGNKQLRNLVSMPLLALIAFLGHSINAQSPDHALTQSTLTLEWSESPEQLAANLQQLNREFKAAKGSRGARFANYSIRDATRSLFEFYDQEGLYITNQERRDYSHQLEIRLKPGMTVDFEALPQSNKQITLVVDAVAKTVTEIRRLVHASEVDGALAARGRLNTPSSLTVSITVTDVEERPVVTTPYLPSSNHQRGFLLRLNAQDGAYRLPAERVFRDPEGRPLFFKEHTEDVEVREFVGYSPNFGERTVNIGSTENDTNYIVGNSPITDGSVVRVRIEGTTIVITPVAGVVDRIRKAEIWVRGWDHRGPTAVLPRLDPATAESLAKITVLVQTGNNRLPQWSGNATGFSISVREGFTGPLVPQFGSWDATDPDNDQITYALFDTTTRDACASPAGQPGISFAGACIRLQSTVNVVLQLDGDLDYELVRSNPVGQFTLLAIDSKGAVAEATIRIQVLNVDEPITGGFKTSALSIHLPTTAVKRFDLSTLFFDPEDQDTLTFRATSGSSAVVSVNERPDPILEITALRLGRTTIHAWATSTTGETRHSSMTVIVKDTNEPPEFPGGVSGFQMFVAETAPIGTKLTTTISATDPDFGDVLTFSLEDNDHFRLSSEGLPANQIQLATKAQLDFETQANYALTLTVSDDVTSDDVEIRIGLLDIDEAVRATPAQIAPIHLSVNGTHTFDAKVHFVDEDGHTPHLRVGSFDSTIAEIFVRNTGEVQIFAKSNGTTEVTLTATDTSGGVAAKRFTVTVEESEPPMVSRPVPDQSIQTGLVEISLVGLFTDPDSDVSIAEVSSSDEDVVWAILPRSEPDTLVLYAWKVGTADITVIARDPAGNEASHTFTVTVTDEEPPVTEALIPDQTLTVGQRHGSLSLLEAFSTAEQQPTSFEMSSSAPSTVAADIANSDVIAWWHALTCTQKVAAVGDTGGADASNPYCQDFVSLSVQHKVIVRAVAGHHALLQGIALGSAEITVTATYGSGAITTTSFTATVEAMVASVASSVPQHVAYLGEPLTVNVQNLLGVGTPVNVLKVAARESDIASVRLSVDQRSVEINGIEIGSTSVALLGIDATGQAHAIQFSVRVANRAPQVSASSLVMLLEVGEEPYIQDLHAVFSDTHALRFELMDGQATDFIDASIQDSDLVVSPRRKGSTHLAVRATDTFGASATAVFEITVSEDLLNEAASEALAGYSRAILSSVSSVIGSRVSAPLRVPDLQHSQAGLERHLFDERSSRGLDQVVPDLGSTQDPIDDQSTVHSGSALDSRSMPHISHTFAKADDTSYWTLWSDSDSQSYHGDSHRGQTRSHYVGTDVVVNNRIQAGLAGSQTKGTGDYRYGNAQRWFDIEQSFLSPYMRYQVRDDISIWTIASMGRGRMALAMNRDEKPTPTHELSTSAVIFGAASELTQLDRLDLAWSGDIAHLLTNADALDQDGTTLFAREQRVRSGLSASYNVPISSRIVLEPFLTVNLRYDKGNDQEGGGLESIGGARMTAGGFDVEIRGRRFELSDKQAYREQGFAISTTYNSSRTPLGWSFSLTPTWGDVQTSFNPFSSHQNSASRFNPWVESNARANMLGVEGSLSYGIVTDRDRFILTPYLETRANSVNEHRLGVRLQGLTRSTRALEFDLMMKRVGQVVDDADVGVVFAATLRL
ncbi:MAG: hypothetical protein OXG15_03255 [Gammaproteobacteria bacterium]|nr:hypothetical protein [Gammaproteobacteria bacterium]